MDGDIPPLGDLWRLKSEYGFTLYCDEAHSFLSLGSTGLGCLQYWNENHSTCPLPWDSIDIRTGTLSKAIGGIGGFIAGKSVFKERIRRHVDQIQDKDHISIPTSTMVQTLLVMEQPRRILRNLRRLSEKSKFCRAELDRLGVYVYGDETGTPILPIWAGRPSASARLSFALRQAGLLASPVTTPAVPFWESRVRVNLSADYSHADVERLINSIVSAVDSIGLSRRRHDRFWVNEFKGLPTPEIEASDESRISFAKVKSLIDQASVHFQHTHQSKAASPHLRQYVGASSVDSGHSARSKYGIGAGSARWISGTFPVHLAVEQVLARAHNVEAAMTYADATIGLASTIAALARPVIGHTKHYIPCPQAAKGAVRDGLTLISPGRKTGRKEGADQKTLQYRSVQHLLETVGQLARLDACSTVIVHAQEVHLLKGLTQMAGKCPMTILLHSPSGAVNVQEVCTDISVSRSNAGNVQVLVYGSFYKIFNGLPGGYLVGSEALVRELRYTSRGYMYTTSTPSLVMDMIRETLEAALERA